jgi:hypothetical protein
MTDERRASHRIRLFTPVSASTDEGTVMLLDLSVTGARVEHRFPLRVGSTITLRLAYEGRALEVPATILRIRMQQRARRVAYVSALQFHDAEERIVDAVRDLIKTIVGDDLPARTYYSRA